MPVEERGLSSRQTLRSSEGQGIGKPSNSEECSEATDGVTCESEGRTQLPLLSPVRQGLSCGHPGTRLRLLQGQQGRSRSGRTGLRRRRSVWGGTVAWGTGASTQRRAL